MYKIDCLRSFLEKYGHRLTSQSHLRELIPSVLQKEKETLKSELSEAKAVSTIFDGSTHLGEDLAFIVQFVNSQWNVQQRLVRLQVLAKSLKAEELAQCLIQALAVEYAIQLGGLLAAMKDGASVNQAALQQVRFFFPQLLDDTCFSHTIDNVGKHFKFRVLDTFAQYWVSLFSHSAAARLAWWPKPKHVSIRGCSFFRESLAKIFMRTFVPSVVPDCVVQYKSSNFAPQQLPWRS